MLLSFFLLYDNQYDAKSRGVKKGNNPQFHSKSHSRENTFAIFFIEESRA